MTVKEQAYESIVNKCCALFLKSKSEINENTDFVKDLHAKSVNITMMLNQLEDEFDVEIPFMKFRRCKTVGDAAAFIAELVDE